VIQTLADALAKRGYDSLTPVQEAVTDPALEGRDLLVSAQTGSGKTVGFGLAIAPTLLGDNPKFGPAEAPLALIIAPTRELAMQVRRELEWLYNEAGAVITSCVGGMDARAERRALESGAHVVVATPGRLCDHIDRGNIDLDDIRAVVLDEADEMLDMGFREDLERILGAAPEDRRTLLFSATVPRGIANLARRYQRDAERVATTGEKKQHSDISYKGYIVTKRDAENAVINVLRYYEAQNALVFCNTRAAVARLTTRFSNRGFSVVALSGELTQTERTNALQAMRDGRARVCVATDVAARGIDLPRLDLVVHAELPSGPETLLHRSGRTGRAGRKGVSALIVPGNARRKAERLLSMAKLEAEWMHPPSVEEVLARDEERLLSDPIWEEAVTDEERTFVENLTAKHDPERIAAAVLRLSRARQSAPEDLSKISLDTAQEVRERPPKRLKEEFGPSVWFTLPMGRATGAEPRRILPIVCRSEAVTGADIGAIRVFDTESWVQISESKVAGLIESLGPNGEIEKGVTLRRAQGEPPANTSTPPGAPGGQRPPPGKKPFRPQWRKMWWTDHQGMKAMDAIRFIGAVALAGTLAGCAGTTGLDTGGFGTVPPAVVKPALPPVAQTIPAPSPQQVAVAAPRARIAPPPTVRVPAAPVAPPSYIAAPSRIAPPVVAAPPVMVQRAAPQYVPEPVIATVPAPVAIPAPAPVQVVRAPEPTYTPVGDMDAVAAAPAPPPAAPAAPAPTYEQVAQVRPVRPVPRVRAMAPIRDEPADSRADRRATNSELRQHARKGYRRNAALRAGGPASAIRSNFTPAFGTKLEQAALERLNPRVRYDARYVKIGYPWGDVDEATGVCTDVVIRSYRALGIDLQELVHEDMKRAFRAYPSRRIYGLTKADPNIDHRRVVNLEAFFERTGAKAIASHRVMHVAPGRDRGQKTATRQSSDPA